jgi:hypothetical protein
MTYSGQKQSPLTECDNGFKVNFARYDRVLTPRHDKNVSKLLGEAGASANLGNGESR